MKKMIVRSLSVLSLFYLVCKKRDMDTYECFRHTNDHGVKKKECYGCTRSLFLFLSFRKGGFLFCVLSQHSTTITSFPGSLCLNRFPGVTDDVMATVWKTQEMERRHQKETMGCRLGADPKSDPTPLKLFSYRPKLLIRLDSDFSSFYVFGFLLCRIFYSRNVNNSFMWNSCHYWVSFLRHSSYIACCLFSCLLLMLAPCVLTILSGKTWVTW